MYNITKITDDISYIGLNDRRIELFENAYPVKNGVSYNSYMIDDEKTVLLDTVDWSAARGFMENVLYVLSGRPLDYVIVDHMEPDHAATLGLILEKFPEAKVYGTLKVADLIKQFHGLDIKDRFTAVKEGDTLNTGRHTLHFTMAPMVHWPEVMMTYDETDKVLFSADAFGRFGALSGNIFEDEAGLWKADLDDARRYYTNIVGKYGANVQNVLRKAAALDISMICPLHGPVLREDLGYYIDLYLKWSSYTPEDKTVLIAYGSVYGGTENAAEILASKLAALGVKNIRVADVSKTHVSDLVSEAFRVSNIVIASPTHDGNMLLGVEVLLSELKYRSLQNRTFAVIENGTWAPLSGKLIKEELAGFKNCTVLEPTVTVKSAPDEAALASLDELAAAIAGSLR